MRNAGMSAAMLRATRTVGRLLRLGVPMGSLRLLETVGRRSGVMRSTPVALVKHAGERWLVSPFGDVHWVHNVRAQPGAYLLRLRRRRPIRLAEVDSNTAAPVLAAFRRRYRMVPFIRPAFDADHNSHPAVYLREADRHPVFRILDIESSREFVP